MKGNQVLMREARFGWLQAAAASLRGGNDKTGDLTEDQADRIYRAYRIVNQVENEVINKLREEEND